MKVTYVEFLKNILQGYSCGIPIYTSDLTQSLAAEFQLPTGDAAAAVAVAIKRIMDSGSIADLRFFQKGIYYRTKKTPFGETGINKEILIADKYLAGNNGYETGLALLHHMGLTTQIPTERVFATNKAANCIRADNALGIFICPPKVRINAKNKAYLQTLDAIDSMNKAPIDADYPYHLMAEHIQKAGLDYGELLALAGKHYNRNTVFTLAQIAGVRSWNEPAFG